MGENNHMKNKFKIGDKVRHKNFNRVGTVTEIWGHLDMVSISDKRDYIMHWNVINLELENKWEAICI